MSENWGEGTVIMGRYRLVSLLGSGGMGSVWRAEHLQLKSDCAVKLLDPAIAGDEQVLARFIREARAAAALRNRHVVQIFDYGVEEGNAFIVMEMLRGETLGARIDRLGVLPVEEATRFMCQVMRAMGGAHEIGIVHRDLKPENIFICKDEEGEYAKVLDFGVAKVESGALEQAAGVKTQTGMMIGTPFYMSPEQAKARPVDHRADIWALAVITYEALTGRRPFEGTSFADLVISVCSNPIPLPSKIATVPRGFDEWFVHGTQRDIEKRFKSTREMANELMQLQAQPLVGRRASNPDVSPETVPAAGIAARPGAGAARPVRGQGSGRPPAHAGVEQPRAPYGGAARLDLTTGQRAATQIDSREQRESRGGTGRWIGLGVGAVVLAGAAFFAFGRSDAVEEPTLGPAAQAEEPSDVAPVPEPIAPKKVEPAVAPAPTPTPVEVVPPTEAAAQEKEKAKSKDPKSTDSKSTDPKAKAKTEPAPEKEPSKGGTKVPVVDKSSLPPTEWEF